MEKLLCYIGIHKFLYKKSKYNFQGNTYEILNIKECSKCGCKWKSNGIPVSSKFVIWRKLV